MTISCKKSTVVPGKQNTLTSTCEKSVSKYCTTEIDVKVHRISFKCDMNTSLCWFVN